MVNTPTFWLVKRPRTPPGWCCDNGGKGSPSKKVRAILTRKRRPVPWLLPNAPGGIKTNRAVTSATGAYEYFGMPVDKLQVTFCTVSKGALQSPLRASTLSTRPTTWGLRIVGITPASSGAITLRDVIENNYPGNFNDILINVYQLLSTLDSDRNATNGIVFDETNRETAGSVCGQYLLCPRPCLTTTPL